ncbi:MAG: TolC family protein [Gemmataceae bacterium]|nr:TolC family protein [Gemmataceae bacterium]
MPRATRSRPWLALGTILLAALSARAQADPVPVAAKLKAAPPVDRLPPPKEEPRPLPSILPSSYPEGLDDAVHVTLPDVLKLAIVANLDIVQARLAVQRAQVGILRAGSRYLPNLAIGGVYTMHDGRIQNTLGNISRVNRDSLFVGLGSTVTFSISDAILAIPEARALLTAARFGQARVENEALLRVADAYFAVLRAKRQLARLDETLEFLTSEAESDLRGGSKGLLPLIASFVRAGNALPSDQTRVEADVVRRSAERSIALEGVRTAAAELSRLLHLDATVFLFPMDDVRWPLPIPGGEWQAKPMEELAAEALRTRPELAENAALLEASLRRYQAARWRPLVPNVVNTISYGGFGGGPRIVRRAANGTNILGNSGDIADFGSRLDIDIGLQWRLDGLGLGNVAAIRDSRLQVEQVRVGQMQLQDLVVSQVVQSVESIRRSRQRVQLIRAGLYDEANRPTGSVYESLRLNFIRIKGGQGLPLEALDSTRRLSDVLALYADSVTDFDRSRFRLLVALGRAVEAVDATGP